MLIGTAELELYIPGTFSLKEKRFILKSLKQRIRNRFNVSVAEVGHLDKWQKAIVGIACVSNDRRYIDSTLSKIMNMISRENRVEVLDEIIEIL